MTATIWSVNGVSFEVRAGEILGIAGVQGNGQTELAEALTGLRKCVNGKVTILGHDTTHASPRQVIEAGTSHVPEDRHKHGLVLSFPVRENMVLCTYYRSPFAQGIELNYPAIEESSRELVEDIRRAHPEYYDLCRFTFGWKSTESDYRA